MELESLYHYVYRMLTRIFFSSLLSAFLIQDAPLIWNKSAYAPHVCQEIQATWTYPPISVFDECQGR